MTPPDTRTRILDAAEALFAEHGIGATTLRALTRRAGVNLAAVHYHFGSKEGLLDAVVGRLAEPINQERAAALDALERPGAPMPTADAVLTAFFEPVIVRLDAFERADRTATLARLVARIEAQPRDEVARLAERYFGAIARRTVDALARALPALDRAVVSERFLLATAVLTALFSDDTLVGLVDPDDAPAPPSRDVATRAREALAFAIAGLTAAPAGLADPRAADVTSSPSPRPARLAASR